MKEESIGRLSPLKQGYERVEAHHWTKEAGTPGDQSKHEANVRYHEENEEEHLDEYCFRQRRKPTYHSIVDYFMFTKSTNPEKGNEKQVGYGKEPKFEGSL